MRILYLSSGKGPDYLCDMAFHGLRSLFGADVVDVNPMPYMYKGYPTDGLYGRGFTMYGLLEDHPTDRTDIPAKIASRFYDFVIFGSIQRCTDYFGEVTSAYPRHKILFLDGEDNPSFFGDCVDKGIYYKRELHNPQRRVLPIQFAIPEEKLSGAGRKSKLLAALDPMNTQTYIYHDEKSYYEDYRTSLFAKTMKKAGYDCLRHYEIMACECIPWFVNLDHVPHSIMCWLPKNELLLAKNIFEYENGKVFQTSAGKELWADLNARIQSVLREHLTTTALAKRILQQAMMEA